MREQRVNEVIDSMKFSKRKLNEINESMKRRKAPRVAYTEHIADRLVGIYNAPQSRAFFLKCAWNLPEDTIWSAVEDSQKKCVETPIALFIFLCKEALKTRPIKG